jgi:uncharacterized linocin/CFP29 family protein
MNMDDLRRKLAPISQEAWKEIDEQARSSLKALLGARRIVDFTGPLGWIASAVELGQVQELASKPQPGVSAALRKVQRLVEFRAPFQLSRVELDSAARGAKAINLDPVRNAAHAIGIAEDRAIFHGYPEAEIVGICEAAAERALTITRDYQKYAQVVSDALCKLQLDGVGGPFAIALGPECYRGLMGTVGPGGYPVLHHVQRLIEGPVFLASGVQGALVASLRGGDFELVVGRDFSVGYLDHTTTTVQLYLEESFTFRVLSPEAAVPLVYR